MHDATPGRHQVHSTRFNRERAPETVAMKNLALEQVRHRRQPDMGMRAHVDAATFDERRRAHLIEEDEGADHLALCGGQHAAHLETAEIPRARDDDLLDLVAGGRIARNGIVILEPAHN